MGSTFDPTATIRPYVTTAREGRARPLQRDDVRRHGDERDPEHHAGGARHPGSRARTTPSTTNIPVSPGLTPAQCATMTLDYTFGQPSFTGNPGNFPFVSRYGRAFGDIFHAAPAIVGPPGTLLQDPGYSGFQNTLARAATRIAYVATNDGLLHAFWADETKQENNERWAMLLPAVMPNLTPSYPVEPRAALLDGSPVVKDVAWDRSIAERDRRDRVAHDARRGLRPEQPGVLRGRRHRTRTRPSSRARAARCPRDAPAGPHLPLAAHEDADDQLSRSSRAHSATPAITTLFMDPGDGNGAREIGVAILPGGADGRADLVDRQRPSCARTDKTNFDAQPRQRATRYRAGRPLLGQQRTRRRPTRSTAGRSPSCGSTRARSSASSRARPT